MRIINAVLAVLIGIVCWGLTMALSGGVAPLGRVGAGEGLLFFMPVLLFALPLACVAFARNHVGTGLWLGALAPLFGFLNFALAFGLSNGPIDAGPSAAILLAMALGWAALLALGNQCIRAEKQIENPSIWTGRS